MRLEKAAYGSQPMVVYQQEPAKRAITMESDAWLPAMQAVLIAGGWSIAAGFIVGIVVYLAHWAWWLVPAALLPTFALMFAYQVTSIIRERRELLWKREELEGRDLNGDGTVGEPETLTVELVQRHPSGSGRIQFIEFGVDAKRARFFAEGLLHGRSFSESEWTGNGRPFSRKEFRELRSELLERGLLEWRNPRAPAQGVELTAPGRHVMAKLAEQ